MFRDELPRNRGMLFVFPDERRRSFWMKNTRIPLDIIYAHNNKIIIIIHVLPYGHWRPPISLFRY